MAISERRLRYFAATARLGSVRAAAESLRISEPTLSAAIRRLEEELGLTLFHRVGGRLRLSDAGRSLLDAAGPALGALDYVAEVADGLAGGDHGTTTIAVSPGVSVSPFAEQMERLASTHPALRVDVTRTFNARETLERVADGTCELGLVPRIRPLPGMVEHRVGQYEVVLAYPPRTAPPAGQAVEDAQLDRVRFIAGSPGGMTAAVLERVRRAGAEPEIVLQGPDPAALPGLVARGVGATLVTSGLAAPLRAAGAEIRTLRDPVRALVRLVHREAPLSPTSERFLEAAMQVERERRSRLGIAPEPDGQ